MTKHKVVCVWGDFKKKHKFKGKWDTDFVLEPACDDEDCEICGNSFWIYDDEEIEKIRNEKTTYLKFRNWEDWKKHNTERRHPCRTRHGCR